MHLCFQHRLFGSHWVALKGFPFQSIKQVTAMDIIFKILLFLGTITVTISDVKTRETSCATPQYLTLESSGIIQCSFREDFYGVYWYKSTYSANAYPFVTYQESIKGGDGYLVGAYDVLQNGSLVINRVSIEDDNRFRVIVLETKDMDPAIHDIRVYVTVKSKQPYPYISVCGEEPSCLVEQQFPETIACSVTGTRPAVTLSWTVQHENTYLQFPYETKISAYGNLFTTNVRMTVPVEDSYVVQHFVCTSVDPPGVLERTKSHLFLDSASGHTSSENTVSEHVKYGTKLTLSCLENESEFVIWKRFSNNRWETIAHAVLKEENHFKTYLDGYRIEKTGSLVIPRAVISHEGSYMCMFRASKNYSPKIIDVVVFVPPEPNTVIIQGCLPEEKCVLTLQEEGKIACTVKGVRPTIKLEWYILSEEFSEYISFSLHKQNFKKIGDRYDVTLTSHFKLKKVPKDELAIECRVSGWDKRISNLDKTMVLHFSEDKTWPGSKPILVAILSFAVIALILVIITVKRKKRAFESV